MELFWSNFHLLKSLNTQKPQFWMLFLKIFCYFRLLKILQQISEHIPCRCIFKVLKNDCSSSLAVSTILCIHLHGQEWRHNHIWILSKHKKLRMVE